MKELKKEIKNGRILKKAGSWLYCDRCNKTVGYLCYTTYQRFTFRFDCLCGNAGFFELKYETNSPIQESQKELRKIKNRLCCANDNAPLFTVVEKNIKNYSYDVVCNKCHTRYKQG